MEEPLRLVSDKKLTKEQKEVAILIIMEEPLRQRIFWITTSNRLYVAILIIMEEPLRHGTAYSDTHLKKESQSLL